MGIILDSSVLVHAERRGLNSKQTLAIVGRKVPDTEIGMSVVTVIELAHGVARADTAERKVKRQQFIEELISAIPVYPVTVSLAFRTGQIDGENQARGMKMPLADLLIGLSV